MMFKEGSPLYATEIERKSGENVIYVNYMGASFSPSIADGADVMARVIDSLTQNPNVSRVVFVQQRNYNYDSKQVLILSEISGL